MLHQALLLEWKSLAYRVASHEIVSIYFGGGTPTLFGNDPIESILQTLFQEASIAPDCEITLEANPEDVTLPLMSGYKKAGINRVSLGVQSLQDASLQVLERTHDANKAIEAVSTTYAAGIHNISIDLMYELPQQTAASFEQTLLKACELPISHLSLYNLTIEPHTSFYKRQKTLLLPTEEENCTMLSLATLHLENKGLKRYEISAFAKEGYESRHNIGYWTARPFFGLGPSAFSYYAGSRFRNCANINRYVQAVHNKESPVDFEEKLPYPQSIHELLAVQLRLIQGVNLAQFPLPEETHSLLQKLMQEGFLEKKEDSLKLTEKGLLFYDTVAAEII